MADVYRRIRAERPAMARLLFKRIKRAEQAAVGAFWSQGSERAGAKGGLRALLESEEGQPKGPPLRSRLFDIPGSD